MNNYSMRLWLLTNTTEAENHNIAFDRLKYFIYSEIDSTIFINQENIKQCQLFATSGLKITSLPGEPVDQLIGIMLYYKLNAILEDRLLVVENEISSTLGENMTYLHSENEMSDDLPKPNWCMTPDLSHCDIELLSTDKVVTMQQNQTWRDLELVWIDAPDNNNNDNTVVFADFKKDDSR
jgi:hypothetical protein